MGYYAKVQSGVVTDVIAAQKDFIDQLPHEDGVSWVKTSRNTKGGVHYVPDSDPAIPSGTQHKAIRYNYAIIGGHYDADADAFYEARPFPSWTLNTETYEWDPPYPRPECTDPSAYIWDWDERTKKWVKVILGEET